MPDNPADLVGWGMPLPPRRTPYIKIVWPTPHQPVRGIVLSPSLHTVPTHFLDGRTRPCMGNKLFCEGCRIGGEPRFNGYLAIVVPPHNRLALAHLTAEAVRSCTSLHDAKVNLRGSLLVASREGKSIRGKVKAELTHRPAPSNLPPEFDVRSALLNIWGMLPGSSPRKGRTMPGDSLAEGEIPS